MTNDQKSAILALILIMSFVMMLLILKSEIKDLKERVSVLEDHGK